MANFGEEVDSGALMQRGLVLGAGAMIALSGLALASFALAATRKLGRRGIFGRALFGLILNSLAACAAFLGIGALMKLNRDLEKLRRSETPVTFEQASAITQRRERYLERAAARQTGDVALVSQASSEYLKKLRLVGDDFGAKTKLLIANLDLSGLGGKEDLQSRQIIVRQFIESLDRFETFLRNQPRIYRDELTRAGVSAESSAAAMEAFHPSQGSEAFWDANHKLAQAQLECLRFLETNWGTWSYARSKNMVEFDSTSTAAQYNRLSAEVTRGFEQLARLQKKPVSTE